MSVQDGPLKGIKVLAVEPGGVLLLRLCGIVVQTGLAGGGAEARIRVEDEDGAVAPRRVSDVELVVAVRVPHRRTQGTASATVTRGHALLQEAQDGCVCAGRLLRHAEPVTLRFDVPKG